MLRSVDTVLICTWSTVCDSSYFTMHCWSCIEEIAASRAIISCCSVSDMISILLELQDFVLFRKRRMRCRVLSRKKCSGEDSSFCTKYFISPSVVTCLQSCDTGGGKGGMEPAQQRSSHKIFFRVWAPCLDL